MFGVAFLPLVPPFVLVLSLLGAECLPLVPLFVVVVVVVQSIFNALCSANHSILLVLFSTKDIIWGGISFASYPLFFLLGRNLCLLLPFYYCLSCRTFLVEGSLPLAPSFCSGLMPTLGEGVGSLASTALFAVLW
jgi:hypothetical protein